MDITKLFPSAYFRATDISTPILVTVTGVDLNRKMSNGEAKHILAFKECDQELVLNKTNGKTLAALHGRDSDDWVGKQIVLFKDTTQMQGNTDCIRIRAPRVRPAPTTQPAPVAAQPAAPAPQEDDDEQNDVPF